MMAVQSRQTKVLVALLASIIAGALVLNALGYNPPSAGAFCLSRYYRLAPVEKAVACEAATYRGRWRRIEIFCTAEPREGPGGQASGGQERRTADGVDANYHFVIYNGRSGRDGYIEATEYWKKQWSVIPPSHDGIQPDRGDALTIFIFLVTDGKTDRATDFQVKRSEALVEELCRRFDIRPESIHYPDSWR
jgi:hypothetical protein